MAKTEIEKRNKGNVADLVAWYLRPAFNGIDAVISDIGPRIIKHTIENGLISISWENNEKSPVLTFSDECDYVFRKVNLLKVLRDQIDFYDGEDVTADEDRNFRFITHLHQSIRLFIKDERERAALAPAQAEQS